MRILLNVLGICLFFSIHSFGQYQNSDQQNLISEIDFNGIDYRIGDTTDPEMEALRIIGNEISLDGNLDETVWAKAPIATGFTQRFPIDGGNPSQKTEARILYTDTYIFVGIMAFETSIDSVTSLLFRRDGSEVSDWVYVSFDSYNDKRTAFTFAVNPKGVQKDILYFDDVGEDVLWDAVWQAASQINKNGWSVEMKIPLSQLRFSSKNGTQNWGINFQRRIARTNEIDYWAPTSQKESGAVSRFGRLMGISNLTEPRRLEIAPYLSTKLTREPNLDANNPYYKSNAIEPGLGGDIKYGITSDLTLTATINPDFGQVEADPATINLSAFEIFFQERRPFFLEGNDIFSFGNTRSFNSVGNPLTFYSRRIGRSPQGSLSGYNSYQNSAIFNADSLQSVYQDQPDQTRITAAAKLSGKTKTGWSIGVLDAYTLEETANYTINQGSVLGASKGTYAVEPTTNYLVSRVKKDINEGNSVVGGFFSAVNRNISDTYFENYLRNSAYIVGTDFEHNWNAREYVVSGTFSLSQINGSIETISAAQKAPQRHYQRPDSKKLSVDATKTSLGGFSTELSVQKTSGDHFTGSLTYSEVSPGYETNDLGFQNRADYRAIALAFQYQETAPKRVQFYELWSYHLHGWNYDGDRLWQNYNLGGFVRFKNQWYFNGNVNTSFGRKSDRLTRGGPIMNYNDDLNINFNLSTDNSKRFAVRVGQFHRRDIKEEFDDSYWINLAYRPTTFIQLSVEPQITFQMDQDQYVATIQRNPSDPDANQTYGYRYIFADSRGMDFSTEFRLNWTFTTRISLQTFIRPFVASSRFSNFGEFNNPGGFDFDRYGIDEGTITNNGNGQFSVDIDEDGSNDFAFQRPNFTYSSIQGNAVFRWEYKPGSTFFLVWQQQRDHSILDGSYNLERDIVNIFDARPTNVFLLKFSYWFGK